MSKEVIDRIAKALRLSPSDTAYFRSLAGKESANTEQSKGEELRDVQVLIDGFSAGPAMLWNDRFDCIAFNYLADVIYEWSKFSLPFGRNVAWRNFMDPERLGFYDERALRSGVGLLRVRYAKHIGEPGFESLVATLLESSTTFRRLWNEQQTASLDPFSFDIAHPKFGILRLRSIRALYPALPESTLVFVMRQRGTSFGRSPQLIFRGRLPLTSSAASALIRANFRGRIACAAQLPGAGTANVFSREHTVS